MTERVARHPLPDPQREKRQPAWRDIVAQKLANAALRLATPWYRGMVHGAIVYGLRAATEQRWTRQEIEDHLARDMAHWMPAGSGESEGGPESARAAARIIAGRLK